MPDKVVDIKRVLFVCPENSARSPMAEAFAAVYGTGRLHASSAGTGPSGSVHPTAVEVMFELGYDIRGHCPGPQDEASAAGYDAVVYIGCSGAHPRIAARHREEWEVPDPGPMPIDGFRAVRDLIEEKVKELLTRL